MRLAQTERHALCDTLLAVGPDAPTLCTGWATRDLLAHLILRETRADLIAGAFLPPLAGRLQAAQDKVAGYHFPTNVATLRSGPPAWSPMAISAVDEAANRMEFFVHHEDVLRAQPGASARDLDADTAEALWTSLARGAGLLYRRAPVGVVLVADGVGRTIARPPQDLGTVVVRGKVADLVMFSYGRKDAAPRLKLTGPEDAVAALRGAPGGV